MGHTSKRLQKSKQKNNNKNNVAFLDFENLKSAFEKFEIKDKIVPYAIKYKEFVEYIQDRYAVDKIYCFLGYHTKKNKELYDELKCAGLILHFNPNRSSNADAHITYRIMHTICSESKFNKIVIISGDSDFIPLIEHLIDVGRLKKILFPTRIVASSYYQQRKKIIPQHYTYLDSKEVMDLFTRKLTQEERKIIKEKRCCIKKGCCI